MRQVICGKSIAALQIAALKIAANQMRQVICDKSFAALQIAALQIMVCWHRWSTIFFEAISQNEHHFHYKNFLSWFRIWCPSIPIFKFEAVRTYFSPPIFQDDVRSQYVAVQGEYPTLTLKS